MNIQRSGNILNFILSTQITDTITPSGSGQLWYETDNKLLKFSCPQGEKTLK
jgi:hypothetical protein